MFAVNHLSTSRAWHSVMMLKLECRDMIAAEAKSGKWAVRTWEECSSNLLHEDDEVGKKLNMKITVFRRA